jgi:osmotically-inducible protein OsmY
MPRDYEETGFTEHHDTSISKRPQIEEAAERRLRQSRYLELRAVSCEFHEGVLTLRGRVPSYYLKQMAQSLVDRIPGVSELDNQLEVGLPRAPSSQSRPSSSAGPRRRRPR